MMGVGSSAIFQSLFLLSTECVQNAFFFIVWVQFKTPDTLRVVLPGDTFQLLLFMLLQDTSFTMEVRRVLQGSILATMLGYLGPLVDSNWSVWLCEVCEKVL